MSCNHLRINPETGLASSERNIDTSALVCHERSQGLDLVSTNVHRITDAALARGSMVRMLSTISADHFDGAVVALKREVDLQNVGAVRDGSFDKPLLSYKVSNQDLLTYLRKT